MSKRHFFFQTPTPLNVLKRETTAIEHSKAKSKTPGGRKKNTEKERAKTAPFILSILSNVSCPILFLKSPASAFGGYGTISAQCRCEYAPTPRRRRPPAREFSFFLPP